MTARAFVLGAGAILALVIGATRMTLHMLHVAPPPTVALPLLRVEMPPAAVATAVVHAARPPQPSPVMVPIDRTVRFDVEKVEGTAERRRGGALAPLSVGDRIDRADLVSTSAGSSVQLRNGSAGTTIHVSSSSRLRIDAIEPHETRLTLERGRVRASAAEGGRVSMKAEGTDASAESVGGDFTMQAEANGTVRVVSHHNKVTLFARDEHLEVGPGGGAIVAHNLGPRMAPVPARLLLKVRWPPGRAQRERDLAVKGQTAPGAVVRSGDSEIVADARGRFVIHIPLREGPNKPRVTVEDLFGRALSARGRTVTVDSHRPLIEHEGVRYGQ